MFGAKAGAAIKRDAGGGTSLDSAASKHASRTAARAPPERPWTCDVVKGGHHPSPRKAGQGPGGELLEEEKDPSDDSNSRAATSEKSEGLDARRKKRARPGGAAPVPAADGDGSDTGSAVVAPCQSSSAAATAGDDKDDDHAKEALARCEACAANAAYA
jgi:hypothetical protein